MRREVGAAFLLGSAGIRQADRVTATEVRMLGMEIENVLGGAFWCYRPCPARADRASYHCSHDP